MVKRVDSLTDAQRARMGEWADRWIAIGLSTERADWDRFETAARACYRYAGLADPRVVVRVPSPLVAVLAGPIAGAILDKRAVDGAAVHGAVGGAVRGAVDDAVGGAVGRAVRAAVHGAVDDAVGAAVRAAVRGAVDDAVGRAVGGAVDDAVGGAVGRAVDGAVRSNWYRYLGGQFWVGGWWWGSPSFASFFLDVCGLELPGDLGDRARAYAETASSACWWWPHREFVMVSDRPLAIHTELVDPNVPRGLGSHRLHNADGPAVVWPDGFGVWAWHGVRVPADVIETPADEITPERINGERNAEIRRVLIERIGAERYVRLMGGERVATDDWGTLWRAERPDDEPMLVVELVNSTPEPDGTAKRYWFRVPGTTERVAADRCLVCDASLEIVPATPHAAVAWGYALCTDHYAPAVQS